MLYVITGPPAAGKTTWMREHAQADDITVDFDAIAATLTPNITPYDPPRHVLDVAIIARQAAINAALRWSSRVDVYIIHSAPTRAHLAAYHRFSPEIITIDPGRDVCIERAHATRPARQLRIIDEWYANHSTTTPAHVKAAW